LFRHKLDPTYAASYKGVGTRKGVAKTGIGLDQNYLHSSLIIHHLNDKDFRYTYNGKAGKISLL
jgi:hypothetical protein